MAHVGRIYERLQGAQDLNFPGPQSQYASKRLMLWLGTFLGTEATGWSTAVRSDVGVRHADNPVLTYHFPAPAGANPNTAFEIAMRIRLVSGNYRQEINNRVMLNGNWSSYATAWQVVLNGGTWTWNQIQGIGIVDGAESFGILVAPRAVKWSD